jgi:hypothetical protein
MVVTDAQAQAAFDFLQENAEKAARAKATYNYLKEFRKTVKANGMRKHASLPVAAREQEAYADPEYTSHLETLRTAEATHEWFQWQMESSKITLEVWRTYQANQRGKDSAR